MLHFFGKRRLPALETPALLISAPSVEGSDAGFQVDTGFIDARKKAIETELLAAAGVVRLESHNCNQGKATGTFGNFVSQVLNFKTTAPKEEVKDKDEAILEKIEVVFEKLHQEFDEREILLDKKLQSIELMQERETRLLKWFSLPLAIVALVGMLFLFYIAYAMQNSVSQMSTEMSSMSSDINAMTVNTHDMSEGVGNMTGTMGSLNQSISNMDNNMASMTNNVAQMNQNTRHMAKTMEPVGQAALNANPMLGAMRRFMPF